MSIRKKTILLSLLPLLCIACNPNQNTETKTTAVDSTATQTKQEEAPKVQEPKTAKDIELSKSLSYNEHTLEDTYPYKDTTREFQWEKIKERLAFVENFQQQPGSYAVIQNYRNMNREAPTVKNFKRNSYTRVSDSLGVERYQSAPLYVPGETKTPTIYGRDGSLVRLKSADSIAMVAVEGISFEGNWDVPKRYVKTIGPDISFNHIVVVDVKNQNICTLEKTEKGWNILSMNPATSGLHKPPHAQETPTGIFVIQEKKPKMFYYKDGTTSIAGFAPWASRFTNGAYVHGIPVNLPQKSIVEYSASLGTTPRSHMCVRNASSHAKFIYDWAETLHSLVIVID